MALCDRGLAETRAKAQALILAGRIRVDGATVDKAGALVAPASKIEIDPGPRYVSRGGDKLDGALIDFQIDPAGLVCIDIGSSTGGFTDCLLQRGARKVFAIDVGTHQLHDALRADPRVRLFEQAHVNEFDPARLDEMPTLGVVDVSFISLEKILGAIRRLTAPGARIVALVKPQFEVGAKHLRKGVVKSEDVREEAVERVRRSAIEAGFRCRGVSPSRLMGPKGNQEYFLYLIHGHV